MQHLLSDPYLGEYLFIVILVVLFRILCDITRLRPPPGGGAA